MNELPEKEKDDSKFSVRLPMHMHKKLTQIANQREMTTSALARFWIKEQIMKEFPERG